MFSLLNLFASKRSKTGETKTENNLARNKKFRTNKKKDIVSGPADLSEKQTLDVSTKYKIIDQPVNEKAPPVLFNTNPVDQKSALSKKIETAGIVSLKDEQGQIPNPFSLPVHHKVWLIGIVSVLAVIMLTELLIFILLLRPAWLRMFQSSCATMPPQYLSTNQVDIDTYMQQYFANKKPRKSMMIAVSAYSSTTHQTDKTPYLTAYNTEVRDGIVAANFLPVGTVVRFPQRYGEKLFVVEDRMNERFGLQVDIWTSKYEEAKKFGIQYLEMDIY